MNRHILQLTKKLNMHIVQNLPSWLAGSKTEYSSFGQEKPTRYADSPLHVPVQIKLGDMLL